MPFQGVNSGSIPDRATRKGCNQNKMQPSAVRESAIALRSSGLTYGEIRKVLNISKSTLSTWLKKLELPPEAQRLLAKKDRIGIKALAKFNIDRTEKIKIENQDIIELYSREVGKMSNKELMLVGAALYWGEGYKNFGKPSSAHVSFANSDPSMVKVFMRFITEVLKVAVNQVRAKAMLHPNISSSGAINFWHSVTGIPKENFKAYIVLSRASRKIRPKNLLPYGTLQILIGKRQEFFKIKGLIEGIIKSIEIS